MDGGLEVVVVIRLDAVVVRDVLVVVTGTTVVVGFPFWACLGGWFAHAATANALVATAHSKYALRRNAQGTWPYLVTVQRPLW